MKIDLHVHTIERSPCATLSEEQQIRAAIKAGLDGIAITDHDRLVPRKHLQELNEQFAPFQIFTGIEVMANQLHWVVLGIHDRALERLDWNYLELRSFVRSQNGFMILAHPFRYLPYLNINLDSCPPDGVEIESINTPTSRRAEIQALAARLGLLTISSSDAHHPGGIGPYGNVLPQPVQGDCELVEALHRMKPNGKLH